MLSDCAFVVFVLIQANECLLFGDDVGRVRAEVWGRSGARKRQDRVQEKERKDIVACLALDLVVICGRNSDGKLKAHKRSQSRIRYTKL